MRKDLFVALAETTEQLMAQRSVDFERAYIMCDAVFTEVSKGAIIISPHNVPSIIKDVRTRLRLIEDKGGAR